MGNTKWEIDPAHSVIQFKFRHLTITTLSGRFNEISGTVEAGDNFEDAKFSFSANVDSIHTNDEKRDAHLKSADFFDVEKYPKISFSSTTFKKVGNNKFELTGDLTIKDITKPVTLSVEYGGTVKDPWGNVKAGFEMKGKINRTDFGLTWNAQIEAGGTMVSEEITLLPTIQLIQK